MVALAVFMTGCSTSSSAFPMATARNMAKLRAHCAHDVRTLHKRWRKAVRGTPFHCVTVGEKNGYPLFRVRNSAEGPGGLYVSAGIHGDEPAPLWALLEWFEAGDYQRLGEVPILLFPCLNPWGIVENRRHDADDNDLNRLFDKFALTPIQQIREAIAGECFRVGCCLHEDYDAQGAYLYDLNALGSSESAKAILKHSVTADVPIDGRKTIDGSRAVQGVVYRKRLKRAQIPGMPEAVSMFMGGFAERTLTFETPSEFCLIDRIIAHRRFLEQVCRRLYSSAT